MKKLIYGISFALVATMLFSCSKDAAPANYSILGIWQTTSASKNGVEQFGGANTVKSELTYFVSDGSTVSYSYTDSNFNNLYLQSVGTYSKSSKTLNMTANVYNSSNTLILQNVSVSADITLLNANELQIKIFNYPSANDVYIKKYVRL